MQRFYIDILESSDESLSVKNPDLLNQLIKVLRVKQGDKVAFFNGVDDIDFVFEVKEIGKREVYLEKISQKEIYSEIDFSLNIVNALPNKLDKIEYILQKWVEVWVTGFYFFKSDRSQKLLLSENKIERLQKIIIEAVEQSGRSRIPELIIDDNIHLEILCENQNIFFHTDSQKAKFLKNIQIDYDSWVNIFIGPEGGFSQEEIKIFEDLSFTQAYLWNRILRTETTGVAVAFHIIQNK